MAITPEDRGVAPADSRRHRNVARLHKPKVKVGDDPASSWCLAMARHLALQAPRVRVPLLLRALLRVQGAEGGSRQRHQAQGSPPEGPP